MKTKILTSDQIDLAASLLKSSEPVAFPTETVYGLGAPIFDQAAIKKIFSIKARPSDNPLIAHIARISEAERIAEDLDSDFYKLAEKFWPGPLAIVVKKRAAVPDLATAGLDSIAIRMPASEIARELIAKAGEPLLAPSANLSGRPSPTKARHVLHDLDGKLAAVIDGGDCEVGIESTVLSLVHDTPTLLRPGHISKEELEDFLGKKIAVENGSNRSPGTRYTHYAPTAKIQLLYSREAFDAFIQKHKPYALDSLSKRDLYDQLREADRLGSDQIAIFCTESMQRDAALMNRLLRAAAN